MLMTFSSGFSKDHPGLWLEDKARTKGQLGNQKQQIMPWELWKVVFARLDTEARRMAMSVCLRGGDGKWKRDY